MNQHASRRMEQVQAPLIPVVGDWIARHPGTISLAQGVVHYPPPADVTAAVTAADSLSRANRYGLVRGTDDLLTAIADKVTRENGIDVDARRSIIATAGSNMGFMNAVLAIADIDDEIILLSPFYFNHEMAITIAGARPIIVSTDSDYQIDLHRLRSAITARTRAIVTVSPNNPTGAVYPAHVLREVNQLCRSHGIYHISDEAYEYFVYGREPHFSPASSPDSHQHTVSLFSLSKAYGLAGWRIGYMVIPVELETAVMKVQDTNLVCPPVLSQIAGAAAMKGGSEWCRHRIAPFRAVRDMVLERLSQLGDRCRLPRPDGAFYALIQIDTRQSDLEIVEALIRDHRIAVMPGRTFGVGDDCSLRIAYGALDQDTAAEGMDRLVRGLQRLL